MVSGLENTLKTNSKKLALYLKRSRGLTQEGFAQAINTTRINICRIEKGGRAFTMEEYAILCGKFSIDYDTIYTGRLNLIEANSHEQFKMCDNWREHQYSFGNIVTLYIDYFIFLLGEDEFNEFCLDCGVDPLYFFNRQNPVNIEFLQKLMQRLMAKGFVNSIPKIADFAYYSVHQSKSAIRNKLGGDDIFSNLLLIPEYLSKFELNHRYKTEIVNKKDCSVELSFQPREHINLGLWKDDFLIGGFVEEFVRVLVPLACGASRHDSSFRQRLARPGEWTTIRIKAIR